MAGYAASARLHGTEPQFAFASEHAYSAIRPDAQDAVVIPDGAMFEQIDLVGRPIGAMIADWLASIGESWSQLTFFLFDPESWR